MSSIDKPLFGAYLNMARHNLVMVIKHIEEKVLQKKLDWKEDSMSASALVQTLESGNEPDIQKRVVDLLEQHIPFLKLMIKNTSNASPLTYSSVLKHIILHLNQYRFFYCHHLHQPYSTEKDLIESLRYLFDAGRKKVKVRFSLSEEDVEHLVRKTSLKIDGKKTVSEKKEYPLAFVDSTGEISEKGLAFFICLFLEKKYAFLFLKQLKGFKDSRTKATQATLETFTIFSVKIPQPKLISDNSLEGLLMDMLQELKRCPANLFPLLSKEDQQKFRIKTEDQSLAEVEVLQKRFWDRFPYLALRYLALTNSLTDIKFHTDLGKYNFKIYEKEVDGEERIRHLYKQMKGVGHLHDFEDDKMPEDWKQLVKKSHEMPEGYLEPHIVQTYPHYHFLPNGNIGLSITKSPLYPSVQDKKSVIPNIWLSLYELPAFMFLHLLTERKGESESKWILFRHLNSIHKFFKEFAEDKIQPVQTEEELRQTLKSYKLEKDYVPTVLLEYLYQKTPPLPQQKAEQKLDRLIDDTDLLLKSLEKDIERSKEKAGSKQHKIFQTGRLADFMARDMLFFQPPIDEKKGKATGTMFQVLQARLAFYGRDKNLLYGLYKECNLVESDNPHPFLSDLPIAHGIIDYYRNYLNRRRAYLEKMKVKCMKGKVNSKEFHFLHLGERERRQGKSYYLHLATTFMDMPVNFPRGLFSRAIKNYFSNSDELVIQDTLQNNERTNTVFLLQAYLQKVLLDDTQPFYGWKKNYFFIDKLFDDRPENSKESRKQYYYTTQELAAQQKDLKRRVNGMAETSAERVEVKRMAEREYNHFTDSEKKLRHTKACDTVLFLLIKRIFQDLEKEFFKGTDLSTVKLKDISPESDTGILSTLVKVKMEITGRYIQQDELKLKNYGDYRRFLKDNRLKSLLSFYPAGTIKSRKDIEKELEQYDKARIEIQRIILAFESEASIKYGIDLSAAQPGKCYVSFEKILTVIESKTNFIADKKKLITLRDAFMHNDYPDSALFSDDLDMNSHIPIAFQLVEKAKEWFVL